MEMTLGERELDVMSVLWRDGRLTVAEVRERLPAALAYNTVLTILRNLEVKGFVEHTAEGRLFRYSPKITEQAVRRNALSRLVDRLFRGSPLRVVTHLVENGGSGSSPAAAGPARAARPGERRASRKQPRPMIAIWMAYTLATGALVGLTCVLLERIARAAHRATRGIWLGGMLTMVLLAAGAAVPASLTPDTISRPRWTAEARMDAASGTRSLARDGREGEDGAVAMLRKRAGLLSAALHTRLAGAELRFSGWNDPLLGLWALATAFLSGVFVHASLEGYRLRHGLESRVVAGSTVLLTNGVGPSAVGVHKPAILLPTWALELDEALLKLALRHEREHVEARDPTVLTAALLGLVLLPWHLPLWWSWRRLRLSIEVDCDRRVLRAHPGVRRYAQLLLLTAQRAPETPWASRAVVTVATPLRPHTSHLAQRISAMTPPRTSRSLLRTAPAALGVVALAAVVLALPTPHHVRAQEAAARERVIVPHQVLAQDAAAPERVIVRLTSTGWTAPGPARPSILIYTTGGALVGIGVDAPAALPDTLRLDRVPAITADVTDGEVHIEVSGPGTLRLGGTVTGGPAHELSATGRHIVLKKGGFGIRPNG